MEITSIIQHVFKQPSLEGVSLSELERFTAKQPFFAVGQYLLLRKMQDIRDPGFEKQLQKTRLYFENPLWLQQLLLRKNDLFTGSSTKHEPVQEVIENVTEEKEWVNNKEIADEQQPASSSIVVQFENDEVLEDAPATNTYQEAVVENHEITETTDQVLIEEAGAPEVEEIITHKPEPESDHHVIIVDPEKDFAKAETNVIGNKVVEFASPEVVENPMTVTAVEAQPVNENIGSDSTENPENTEELTENEEGKPGFVLPVYTKPAEQTEEQLVFQAYHTIDYFASQGIKISHKAEMSDKLGSQLKSFTEWLKTMKRLPPSKLEQQMEEKESEVVVEMAAHSLESKEVLTETMAEVLLKQGKKESAIEVYNKLSLLNPSKTPYFAAKIEEIKRN